ncbi:hypothetical protein GE061_020234 [Apolygus lucorum]|uniref:Uncharacterized protein n=1 Tax=Apolygus lucorum TaxID=248454 RepID=A0A8S9WM62_APOLU|nr:hypothetical protein GE061_020234 [Apolygus lucorum]
MTNDIGSDIPLFMNRLNYKEAADNQRNILMITQNQSLPHKKKMDLLNQLQAIDNEVESNVRTISVKELPLEEPFMIQDIRKVSTRFGQTVVARLKSRVTGRCEDVWLPRRYGETFIKSKDKYKVNSLSMMYHGIENSSNAFRLTFEMTPEDYNEADNEGDGNNTDSEEEQEFNPATSATTSSKVKQKTTKLVNSKKIKKN